MALAQLDYSIDKPLPQNPEAERSVLGSVLIDSACFFRVIETIRAEDFFKDSHRLIFTAISDLSEQNRAIDLLTVKEQLTKRGVLEQIGGASYISSLVDGIPDIGNVERYAQIVKEKSTMRRLVVLGNSVMRAALDAPSEPLEVLNQAQKSIYDIADGTMQGGFVTLDRITRANMIAIEQIQHAGKLVTGIPTGYEKFDEYTSGFQRQDLIILAARPSMGKTSFMMNMAEAMAVPDKAGLKDQLHSVAIFSLEMSKEQIGLRILSSVAGVKSHVIRSGLLSDRDWRDLTEASTRIARSKIFVDDSASIDIMEMRSKGRKLKQDPLIGLDIIMVDYLQLIELKKKTESRNQEISQISRGLKAIAKELNIPLLSLSQLSRRPEQRTGDHRPQLADLRESGSIEQDADVVAFIYRDEVYNKDSEEKGVAEIIISKQRNGPIGFFKLVFRHDITKFFNYAPEPADLPWQ